VIDGTAVRLHAKVGLFQLIGGCLRAAHQGVFASNQIKLRERGRIKYKLGCGHTVPMASIRPLSRLRYTIHARLWFFREKALDLPAKPLVHETKPNMVRVAYSLG